MKGMLFLLCCRAERQLAAVISSQYAFYSCTMYYPDVHCIKYYLSVRKQFYQKIYHFLFCYSTLEPQALPQSRRLTIKCIRFIGRSHGCIVGSVSIQAVPVWSCHTGGKEDSTGLAGSIAQEQLCMNVVF